MTSAAFVTLGAMTSGDDPGRLTDRERGLTGLLVAVLVAAATLLYAHADGVPSDDSVFSGTFVFDQDAHFYMGMARQAAEGRLLFALPFTPEAHEPALVNLEWLAMGTIARWTGGDVIVGMHVVRTLGIIALVIGVVRLCALVFATTRWRLGATLAALVGGGFGWTLGVPGLAESMSVFTFLDTYAGVHPFFWMMFQPHFVVGQALLVACLVAYARAAMREPGPARTRGFLLATLGAAALTLTRPYDGVVVAGAGALFALSRRATRDGPRDLGDWSLTAGALPLLVHQRALFADHEVFGWLGRQGVLLPPEPGNLVVSLGLAAFVLPFALGRFLGAPALGRDARGALAVRVVLCALVAAVAFLYAYPPITFTLQVVPAVAMPLTIFALAPFEPRGAEARPSRLAALVAVALLVVHAATSVSFYAAKWGAASRGMHRVALESAEMYAWFDEEVEPGAVVMGAFETCNRLPRHALVRTFVGHSFATVDFRRKERLAELFYLPLVDDAFRRHLVDEYGITHVVHGPDEQALGSWDPSDASWLRRVYWQGNSTVYAVR